MPSISATSFWVCSPPEPRPKRMEIMLRSRSPSFSSALRSSFRSVSSSRNCSSSPPSEVRMSESSSSFPSQSVLSGSSIYSSFRREEVLRRYMSISFSMQRLA